MAIEGLSANHIASVGGKFEPQRTNNFVVLLPVGGRLIT